MTSARNRGIDMTAEFECRKVDGGCGFTSDDESEAIAHILARHPLNVVLRDGPTGATVELAA